MAGLLYRDDMDEVRRRLTTWWHGGDLGRPALLLSVPRQEPLVSIPEVPTPEGWTTVYSTKDYDYRLYLAQRSADYCVLLGEAVPSVSPDLGPGSLALFLGCEMQDGLGTAWFVPCISTPETARFEYDPGNFYWDFTLRLTRDMLRLGEGRFLVGFPDVIEGLDILASMRGTSELLTDLIDRPEWVHASLDRIGALYFRYYDMLYDLIRDEVGGSYSWCWAPGRSAKLQCDFSAMIGTTMFDEFMLPVLREMTERISYTIYHWDGPGAITHLDALLSLPRLGMIQWTPGAGAEPVLHSRWWPLYHRVLEAGKSLMLIADPGEAACLPAMRREFGARLNRCMISFWGVESVSAAERILAEAER